MIMYVSCSGNTFLPLKEDNLSIIDKMIHPMCLIFKGSLVCIYMYIATMSIKTTNVQFHLLKLKLHVEFHELNLMS